MVPVPRHRPDSAVKVQGLERWRHAVGFPGYLVSNHGRVFSDRSKKYLRPQPAGRGHLRVSFRREGETVLMLLHRVVLMAFVGPCPEGQEGLHYDDDPTNNRLGNLRWGTRRENRQDAIRNERLRGGKQVGQALYRSQVVSIKRYLRSRCSVTRIAKAFSVSRTTITKIRDGKIWADVL